MKTTNELTRRNFMQTAAGLMLVAGLPSARAVPSAKPWMVACRDAHLKATGQPDCWAALKFLGIGGVEVDVTPDLLCPSLFHSEKKYSLATAAGIKELSADLAAHDATITAFCMHNRFDEKLEEEVAWMRKLAPVAQEMGVKAIVLQVAGAFHSPLMAPAREKLVGVLKDVAFSAPKMPVLANTTGTLHSNDPEAIKEVMLRQVTESVRWADCIKTAIQAGGKTFIEFGPGKVLSGLIRRIDKTVATQNVADVASLDAIVV